MRAAEDRHHLTAFRQICDLRVWPSEMTEEAQFVALMVDQKRDVACGQPIPAVTDEKREIVAFDLCDQDFGPRLGEGGGQINHGMILLSIRPDDPVPLPRPRPTRPLLTGTG